jgi:hypothetical protein
MGDAKSVSLICIHTHDIPQEFSPEALAEAKRARGVALGKRTDLRDTPLITIDGEDARDFDDAVYAEPDGDGFRLIVAIADVAHYVRPGSPLDRAAPDSAAIPAISPTAWCRCCRRRCPTAGAACARTRNAAACSSTCGSTPTGNKTKPPLRPRPDAQRAPAHLRRTGATGADAASMPACRKASSRPSIPPSACCWPPAARAARSIWTCRSARWCWTTRARCLPLRHARAWTATG